jgi:CheY-like chemotaxis protein
MRAEAVGEAEAALKALESARLSGSPFGVLILDQGLAGMNGTELAERIRRENLAPQAAIVMLVPAGQRGGRETSDGAGVAAWLSQPVTPPDLLRALLRALGPEDSEADAVAPGAPGPVLDRKPLSILLAEDNTVNQRLATAMLRKLGHSVVAVANGREAVEAFMRQPFDAILMDMQMPEMDGFQATALIRAEEKLSGGLRHIPIVALTANAMKGDREKCLASGMDHYLSKPIKFADLADALDSLAAAERD